MLARLGRATQHHPRDALTRATASPFLGWHRITKAPISLEKTASYMHPRIVRSVVVPHRCFPLALRGLRVRS
jgi:hypothetical protein